MLSTQPIQASVHRIAYDIVAGTEQLLRDTRASYLLQGGTDDVKKFEVKLMDLKVVPYLPSSHYLLMRVLMFQE